MPEPLSKPVKIMVFCDASHADCLVTLWSMTGILIFVNGTPIRWYSKRQNTVESSTYGSEFVAMRIATEMLLALRTTLRCPLMVPRMSSATITVLSRARQSIGSHFYENVMCLIQKSVWYTQHPTCPPKIPCYHV